MNILRKYILMTCLGATLLCSAGPADEGKRLYKEGNYEAAVESLKGAVRRSPRDGNVNYWLGASLTALGRSDQAKPYLLKAEERGVVEASRLLAIDALDNYDTAAADKHLDAWQEQLSKKKKDVPEEHRRLSRRLMMMSNMLERVEALEVIDSLTVDSADFFNAYNLSQAAGRILPPEAVSRALPTTQFERLSTAYRPQTGTELLWAAADSTGHFALYGADILDDGSVDAVKPLDNSLGEGGDAQYPFLMPDGMTLYFANNGDNTLGGYDIFMTRRDDNGGYFRPQNVGMPYNSPYDDYLLAIDEASGLGWFATDRNRIPGKVTIYVFAPAGMRINVDTADPNFKSLAKLDNYRLTHRPDVDYAQLLRDKLPDGLPTITNGEAPSRFMLDMGNGTVYISLADFKNAEARSAMLEAISANMSLERTLARLDDLRSQYASGKHEVADEILSLESEVASLRKQVAQMRNKAVRLETKN